ncbi:helix-turn-helix domain-containing protein [Streptomyces chrestomyceticus]|uniref:helix-turn-helix domain-containing protein n=1 Tax=Streptomyces chrestomyceticus TaxID=68185 RepID=UPI0033DC8BE5
MSGYTRWQDIRAGHVARAGGEDAVRAGKEELLAEVTGRRLAELRRARGLTQQDVADRMGVTKGRVSQVERGTSPARTSSPALPSRSAAGCTRPSTSTTGTSR